MSKHLRSVLQIEILSNADDDHHLDDIGDTIFMGLVELGLYCCITTPVEKHEISEKEARLIMEQNGDDPMMYNMEDAEDWRYSMQHGDLIGVQRGESRYGPLAVFIAEIHKDEEDGDNDRAVIKLCDGNTIECLVSEIIPGTGEIWQS